MSRNPNPGSDPDPGPLLGRGTFGVVRKKVWDGHWYAVKHIWSRPRHPDAPNATHATHAADVDDQSTTAKVTAAGGQSVAALRELDVYHTFQHCYVPTVYRVDLGIDGSTDLFMGVAQESLHHWLRGNHTMSQRQAMTTQAVWTTLHVLALLHLHHRLHRDVKPDNILLRRRVSHDSTASADVAYAMYLTDFGSCRWVVAPTGKNNSICNGSNGSMEAWGLTGELGTQCYRPPEMNTHQYSTPADVYMLACTALHVLWGELPDQVMHTPHRAWIQVLRALGQECSVSATLLDLLGNMMHPQASRRLTVRQALRHPLFAGNAPFELPRVPPVVWPGTYLPLPDPCAEERRTAVTWLFEVASWWQMSPASAVQAIHLYDDCAAEQWLVLQHSTPTPTPISASGASSSCSSTSATSATSVDAGDTEPAPACRWPEEELGLVCLWLAARFFDGLSVPVQQVADSLPHTSSVENSHWVEKEHHVLRLLNFRLVRRPAPTPSQFRWSHALWSQVCSAPAYWHGHMKTQ